MSTSNGEIQQIPARHGTATFVPKGSVIKIINTYGRQVVDTWAFALPSEAPSQREVDEENEREEEVDRQATTAAEKQGGAETAQQEGEEAAAAAAGTQPAQDDGEAKQEGEQNEESNNDGDVTPKDDSGSGAQKVPGSETETDAEKAKDTDGGLKTPQKAGWSSYIPSIRSTKGKGEASQQQTPKKKEQQGEKRTWASYFPSGQGFSNYVPSSKSISSFASSHERDPTKSYAEQLYDFSKTPVGAGALSGKLIFPVVDPPNHRRH
jgi:hypothetical protein